MAKARGSVWSMKALWLVEDGPFDSVENEEVCSQECSIVD